MQHTQLRIGGASHIVEWKVARILLALTSLLLAGCGQTVHAETVVWNPLVKQQVEADTLFMPDFSSIQTIEAGGGFLDGPPKSTAEEVAQNYDFGPGRFGPAVRGKPGPRNYVFYPVDGLIPVDEFTLEFWARADQPWSMLTDKQAFFTIQGGNFLRIAPANEKLTVQISSPRSSRSWSRPLATLQIDDTRWHSIALTLKQGNLHIYIDGNEAGNLSGVRLLPVWSNEAALDQGIQIGGGHSMGSGVWISDLRISRTARIPGQTVPLRSLEGSFAVNTTAGQPLSLQVGALHPGGTPEQVKAALAVMRTDKLLNVTPIIEGRPDGEHRDAGHSGRFSYNWEAVDRVLDWYAIHGVTPYLSIDSTPSLLGGQHPPFTEEEMRAKLSRNSGYNNTPPTDLSAWAAMVSDLIYYIHDVKHVNIPWYGIWNEPDIPPFWKGTLDQYLDLYAATARAIRSVDPEARIGGPEVSKFKQNWIKALIERCAAEKLPLDFVSFHDYSGDVSLLYQAQQTIQADAQAAGFKTPIPIVIGEFNWSDHAHYKNGYARLSMGMWHLRALTAAYTTTCLISMAQLPGYELLVYTKITGREPRLGGSEVTQLIGTHNEQWAPYNALKGWKQTVGAQILAGDTDLPPGVSALATRNPATGRIGLALANSGYAQRQARSVRIILSGIPAGKYELSRTLVDPQHSSRWDIAEDRPEGASHNDLEVVEQRDLDVTQSPLQLQVNLPAWSSTFITLTPAP